MSDQGRKVLHDIRMNMKAQEYFDSLNEEQDKIDMKYFGMTHQDTRLGLGWL